MPFQFEDLKSKTCVITGGGGVIGHALASALGSVKCNVVIVDLSRFITGVTIPVDGGFNAYSGV